MITHPGKPSRTADVCQLIIAGSRRRRTGLIPGRINGPSTEREAPTAMMTIGVQETTEPGMLVRRQITPIPTLRRGSR